MGLTDLRAPSDSDTIADLIAAQDAGIDALTAQFDDPDWGWLLVARRPHNILLAALGPDARRDLRAVVRSDRLSVPQEGIALYAAGGALCP